MQRRTLLGLAVGTETVGILGATTGFADQPSDPPATYAEEPVSPVGKRNTPVIFADTTTVGSETYGTVRQRASVLDSEQTGRCAVVTRHQLIPGSKYHVGSK